MQSKIERPVSDSIATMHPTANTSRDAGPESEAAQDGKIREIVMDNVDSEPLVMWHENREATLALIAWNYLQVINTKLR